MTEQHEYELLLQKEQQLIKELETSREQVRGIENSLREVRENLGYLQIQSPVLKSA